ncbi:hypothetical protein [Algoriphagus sp. A40]|uniref:hypothetical protein n=1 Tax=Algoriphagus sp. A40 TaxID=1945863 RepID=UPI000986A8A8|nr:hypothetical protein [Algoriphagus sp. A40]OOG76480.1 hypothetical protein B0E43_08315 [Algoriphagus sp. A40]
MKKMILICYLAFLSLNSHAQTFDEWWNQKETQQRYLTEQIAALSAYGAVLKEGYETVSQGLGLVHNLQNGDYTQHQGYFNSFSSVNPQIKNHPEAEQALKIFFKTRQLTQQIPDKLFPSPHLSGPEEQVIRHVLLAIQKDSEQILTELEELLEEGLLQMSDTDRLKQLSGINHRMQDVYGYKVRFYQDCRDISLSRQKESQAIQQRNALYSFPSN